MSEPRDGSPDWLREFQPPSNNVVTISSESDSSPESSPKIFAHTDKAELSKHQEKQDPIQIVTGEDSPHVSVKKPTNIKTENDKILSQDTLKENEEGQTEADKPEKPAGPEVSNRLPLVFTEKVQRSKLFEIGSNLAKLHGRKALVECDGDSIDLSGDVGAVGRIIISNGPVGNHEMFLDLKGTVYKTRIVPSRTFCVVSIGQSEAKVEAIMNDFIQLDPQSNVFEAETMVEGTLDGFSFDSEEELDRLTRISAPQTDQQNENADHTYRRTKDPVHKKAKTAAKSDKKGTKKPQGSKRTKKSKK